MLLFVFLHIFHLSLQVVNVVILFNSLVCGLIGRDQEKVIVDENEKCNSHNCTHYNQEEE